MKLKMLAAAAMIAATSHSNAAIYYISNLVTGTGSSEALFQSDGAANAGLLDGGIVALGYFGTNAYVPSSDLGQIGTTISDFTIVAFALTGSASAQLSGEDLPAGYVDAAALDTANILSTDARVGRALYLFAGNGTTLGNSSAYALKQVATIADDEAAENEYFTNPLGGVAPVIGQVRAGGFTGEPIPSLGSGPSAFTTLQLVGVPEPSALLLGAVGALGLLRRRRI